MGSAHCVSIDVTLPFGGAVRGFLPDGSQRWSDVPSFLLFSPSATPVSSAFPHGPSPQAYSGANTSLQPLATRRESEFGVPEVCVVHGLVLLLLTGSFQSFVHDLVYFSLLCALRSSTVTASLLYVVARSVV